METTLISADTVQREQDLFRTISLTTLLTGLLDITAANLNFYFTTNYGAELKLTGAEEPISLVGYLTHGGPEHIFRYIAKAVFGNEADSGGTLMIIWGAVFHFMIAFFFTAFLFVIYPTVIKWLRNKFVTGFVYGLFVWSVMNLVVVPLSRIKKFPSDLSQEIIAALILTGMIGLPVALIAHRFFRRKGKI